MADFKAINGVVFAGKAIASQVGETAKKLGANDTNLNSIFEDEQGNFCEISIEDLAKELADRNLLDEEYSEALQEALDANKDGKIDEEEYKAVLEDLADENGKINAKSVKEMIDNSSETDKTTSNIDFINNSPVKDKIKFDDETGEPYIEVEAWDPSKGDNLGCVSAIMQQVYGVSYFSDEGKELYEKLVKENPTALTLENPDLIHTGARINLLSPDGEKVSNKATEENTETSAENKTEDSAKTETQETTNETENTENDPEKTTPTEEEAAGESKADWDYDAIIAGITGVTDMYYGYDNSEKEKAYKQAYSLSQKMGSNPSMAGQTLCEANYQIDYDENGNVTKIRLGNSNSGSFESKAEFSPSAPDTLTVPQKEGKSGNGTKVFTFNDDGSSQKMGFDNNNNGVLDEDEVKKKF